MPSYKPIHSFFINGSHGGIPIRLIDNLSDFIWPFLKPYMGVIPNPKMVFIFPISCILVLIVPFFIIYFPKCAGKGSFPKSQMKSRNLHL